MGVKLPAPKLPQCFFESSLAMNASANACSTARTDAGSLLNMSFCCISCKRLTCSSMSRIVIVAFSCAQFTPGSGVRPVCPGRGSVHSDRPSRSKSAIEIKNPHDLGFRRSRGSPDDAYDGKSIANFASPLDKRQPSSLVKPGNRRDIEGLVSESNHMNRNLRCERCVSDF
jgi:hypothetical protein